MREQYGRVLGYVNYLTIYLRDSGKYMERKKIRDMNEYSDMEGTILHLM